MLFDEKLIENVAKEINALEDKPFPLYAYDDVDSLGRSIKIDINILDSINKQEQPDDTVFAAKAVFDRLNKNFQRYVEITGINVRKCKHHLEELNKVIVKGTLCPDYMLSL